MLAVTFNFDSLSSEQTARFDALTKLLQTHNQTHNLTRIIDDLEIRQRHYCDSLIAVDIIKRLHAESHCSIIDIGSGAGFPALPLAVALPNAFVTSVEATGKKVTFQQTASAELDLKNFTPINARAEELAAEKKYRGKFDFAVSRAVADLAVLCELSLPFVRPGGFFLAWKGKKAAEELTNAQTAIKALGAQLAEVVPYTLTDAADDFKIIVIKKTAPTPFKYPRQYNAIKRSPL